MQLYLSLLQSILHLNRCHDIHPIGGVLARPLSRECAAPIDISNTSNTIILFIFWKREEENGYITVCKPSKKALVYENIHLKTLNVDGLTIISRHLNHHFKSVCVCVCVFLK